MKGKTQAVRSDVSETREGVFMLLRLSVRSGASPEEAARSQSFSIDTDHCFNLHLQACVKRCNGSVGKGNLDCS
jgi:hypothetical protein